MKRKQRTVKRPFLILASLALVVLLSVGGTMAFLVAETPEVKNTFTPAKVSNEVKEDIDDNVKNNVRVENTGDIPAYIRAKVVVSWVQLDQDGKVVGVYGGAVPEEGSDYTITYATGTDWVKGADGFYYYTKAVTPKASTDILFTDCKVAENAVIPEGYKLSVEILAQSIQADGVDSKGIAAVTDAWGVSVVDGKLSIR